MPFRGAPTAIACRETLLSRFGLSIEVVIALHVLLPDGSGHSRLWSRTWSTDQPMNSAISSSDVCHEETQSSSASLKLSGMPAVSGRGPGSGPM